MPVVENKESSGRRPDEQVLLGDDDKLEHF